MKETPEQRLRHARYEFEMACHCFEELKKPQFQAQWNVLLAALSVYFRNMRQFLTSSGDQESIKATQYIQRFKATSAEDLKGELNELHWHVLHLSGKRTSKNEQKLGFEKAEKLMRWVVENERQFFQELSEAHKSIWRAPGPAGPTAPDTKANWGYTGPVQASASSHIVFSPPLNFKNDLKK